MTEEEDQCQCPSCRQVDNFTKRLMERDPWAMKVAYEVFMSTQETIEKYKEKTPRTESRGQP